MADPVARSSRPLILVVDDVDDVRELYAECLMPRGYDVIEAADGQQAIQAAFSQHPEVIIMDVDMPVMDGWAASRILRDDARTKDVPIIVVTGSGRADRQRAADDAGVEVVLQKPCSPDVLIVAIERALRDQAVPRRLS